MVKIRKACFLVAIVALFSIVFSGMASAEIIVSPETIHVYLTGGDTVTEQITITWTGEAAVVAFIETETTPDGEGINVTYSEDPVILYPDTPNTIDMTITTAVNIVPGNYTITTLIFTEIEKWIEYRDRGGGTTTVYETVEVENLTRINMLLDIIQQLNNELNTTKGNCTEQIALLNGTIDALNERIDSLEDQLQEEPDEEEDKWLSIIVFLMIVVTIAAIIFIIVMVYLYYKFRVLKSQKQKGKEVKKHEHKNK